MMKTSRRWMGIALPSLCGLALFAGCNPYHDATTITDVDVALDKDGKHKTTTFKPTDHTIYAVGSINGPGSGVKMKAVWTQVDAGRVKNTVLTENDFVLDGNTDVFDGYVTRKTDWPKGSYKTDFYFAGMLNKTVEWQVK